MGTVPAIVLYIMSNDAKNNFTTSVKESYAQPFDQVKYEETCFEPWNANKCTRHRITYKTLYRQVVKMDYRRRYQCCRGFYESRNKCVPRCTKECVHGRCVAPDRCQCESGWRGEDCSSCRFGPNCAKECLCHNGGHCDPEKGQCQCDAGYTGERCNEECPVGTYGEDCKGVCDCANGARCYNIHGGCLCEPGFKGPRCDHRMCPDGTYGMHCEHRCLCNSQNTLSCHPLKGECTCQPGWAGLYCNETCAGGYYGNGCLEPCLCVNGGVCDTVTGQCHCSPGYTVSGQI
uniref:Platelet endothelial aggregation receptor 1-like n=1 Tax=Sinocyclocheilus rhinocerous TaxID=307959 RepID=A0A673N8I9_9TELE